MRGLPLAAALLATALLATPGLAVAQTNAQTKCPPRIEFTPQISITPPAGWTARPVAENHWLHGADLFDGDPAERVQLRPETRGQTDRWDLDPARRHTVVCLYEGTEVTLTAPLPIGTKRCAVVTKAENSRGVRGHRIVTERKITEVTCQ